MGNREEMSGKGVKLGEKVGNERESWGLGSISICVQLGFRFN